MPLRRPAQPAGWEHFPHAADVGVRGFGPTLEEAFAQAALALTAVVSDPAQVAPREAVAVRCHGADAELLLYAWLNALIYEMALRRMLFGRFEVEVEEAAGEMRLRARAWGEPVDPGRHEPAVEPKGATFTELRVCRRPEGGWLAQCVVDV